jgi:hypothetical protein
LFCVVQLWIVHLWPFRSCWTDGRAMHASQLKLSSYVRRKVIQHLFLVCLFFCGVVFFILLFV